MKHQQSSNLCDSSWHSLSSEAVLEKLHSTSEGLTFKEVQKRKKIFGLNTLKKIRGRSVIKRFLDQFNNVLIYILIVSGSITLLLREWVDTIVILGVVILNGIIGFVQENKAEKALDSIRHLLSSNATVFRNGRRCTVPAKSLVPGDIVLLQSGDKIPADIRLFQSKSLQVQESSLTGESKSVSKSTQSVSNSAALADRTSMVYSSTMVTYGRGQGVVVATGYDTEIGRISTLIEKITSLKTPLLQQIAKFGQWLTVAILALSVMTYLFGVLVWHESLQTMFLAVVGIAVAAIPEGLPAIMTITLAIGVTRMARRHAIIRHLPTVETMGSVNVICTDKTGTLTRNEMAIQQVVTREHNYHVTGSGYNATGQFHLNDAAFPLEEHIDLQQLIRASVLCNDAQLLKIKGEWELLGNPVDGAFLSLGLKAKFDLEIETKNYPRTDFIPFESEHKLMAALHHDHKGNGYIFVKGAPERILARCRFERFHSANELLNRDYWLSKIQTLAEGGQRVVAVAMREADSGHRDLQFNDIDDNLILLGMVGLIDPAREEAKFAVAQCQSAGICVKMITGDHAITARAIAEQVGINTKRGVLTGDELDQYDDVALETIAGEFDVYARTSPEHKLRLVRALQAKGDVVAMTGDGVNDSPALKQAEVGIAMGKRGTEAAKEVAKMILTDDNFSSIYHAVEEGRTVYDNLQKAILYILPTSFGEASIIVLAILLGRVLPITPVQILWVNLITAVTLSMSLSFEKAESNVMQRPPRKLKKPILSKLLVWRIFFVSALMVACGFGLFLFERAHGVDLATTRTVVINMLVVSEIAYLFNCRKIHESAWHWKTFFGSKPVLIAVGLVVIFQAAFTYIPAMENFFGIHAIHWMSWVRIFALAILLFVLVELEKRIMRKFGFE